MPRYTSILLGLAALSKCVAGISALRSPFNRDLQLSADLGLDPNILLEDPVKFRSLVANFADAVVEIEYAEIPIDHTNHSVGTYRNRFWASTDDYVSGGPVIVYDVGESNAENLAPVLLTNSSSFFKQMLSDFGAVGIVWEHRYYGDSLPFPVNLDTPAEHFQYLTVKQALADLPHFAKSFSRGDLPDEDLTPTATPWVMVGGSYSGVRAAFTRDEYPDTIYAAWASSAPVEARINMGAYWEQVYRGMNAYQYGNCSQDIHAALSYIDQQLSQNETAAALKQLFFGPGAEQNSNGDFTSALAGVFGFFQSYGMDGGQGSLGDLCNYLETDPNANSTATKIAGPDGFAPIYGAKHVAERWASWPIFTQLVNANFDTNCRGLDPSEPSSCDLGTRYTDIDTISWTWQYCSEWGYFQATNGGEHALLSSYQSLEYEEEICYRQFPDGVKSGFLPPHPRANELNSQTGGWTIRPSNVYWSGGQFDPWRTLSTLSTEAFAPQDVAFTTEIPTCGEQTAESTLFGYIMDNAEHCFDFRSSFEGGDVSRGYFTDALAEWLECFHTDT
ncbi:hypothetical protein ASPZODRAFT_56250 [Penicilliopsis zonata CBS 506.65]|uniref:Serine peptidase, family S28 n=1 Tax=Penicilliopsis zonata CBS 506.65 TaxID=1073090 RepID=A0A1L9STT1_9EURO|nr:hypothetical protein ASPZODRAFT_56250 [Penicilliopsis zonata CBS 506.65]OJJ50608.1 hypothetical protein ASPZODRAFT_56250 [Penicilliopsis zonata CBS 506.65]